MKIRHSIYIGLSLFLAACSDDSDPWLLSPVQQQLIGRSVNFSASHAEEFVTRTTYNHNGAFNQGDLMTIYRQYSEDNGQTFDDHTEAYRVYFYEHREATGSSYVFDKNWQVQVGAKGSNAPGNTFTQAKGDSLTWENGKTVRFRAWSRSNLVDAITRDGGAKNRYYPDYCVSEWVTVSGPTEAVPLTLKHQGCRIGFTAKGGNELVKAEICTEVEDYMRKDNSIEQADDESPYEHGKTLAQAQKECDSVVAVYNQMCMPAGVSVENSLLTTMTKALYDGTTSFTTIHEMTGDDIVIFNTKSPEYIAGSVQRPVFCSNDGRLYLITIPYDMSNADTRGETITLPACTRFKIWLYDVNDGDRSQTHHEEATYHIFTLGDVMDKQEGANRKRLFGSGMPLGAGISYRFSVGYHYNQLTITPADDFSWDHQDAEQDVRQDEAVAQSDPSTFTYQWWKDAIAKAIPKGEEKNYNPQFHITNEREFLEFISLVNNTAAKKTSGLTQMHDHTKTYTADNPATDADFRWYRNEDFDEKGRLKEGCDSATHAELEAEGYIFYQHYYPANADQAAYSREDYLRGAFSFYDENLNRHFTVWLDEDLDLGDWELTSVGNSVTTPFRGVFDGYDETNGVIHTISNANMQSGYLFRYCNKVAIRNLQIETPHNFMLIDEASAMTSNDYAAYVVGVSIDAPCSGNPIARTLTGSSYVVGCFYEGEAGGAMVGKANNLYMYANMMAASGLGSGTGALLGAYADGNAFFAPQTTTKLTWGRFMVNYYDTALSPGTNAVSSIADNYRPQEYIRGRETWILKAKNDNMISGEVPFDNIPTEQMKRGYYGWAPWKAMNYALYQYNLVGYQLMKTGGEAHNCKSHFVVDDTGYAHRYPQRIAGEPAEADYKNLDILELYN